VIDDLIVYRLADNEYLVVANASNAAVVAAELAERVEGPDGWGADVKDRTADYALIAVQGPQAAGIVASLTSTDLDQVRYYASYRTTIAGSEALLARTGYTGEDGFEIFVGLQAAAPLWKALTEAGRGFGLVPAGLAARDSLRLEAGMPLYGNELGRDVTPYDAGLGRVVKLDKPGDFVGRAALAERAEAAPTRVLVGLAGKTRRVPRHGYSVLWNGEPCGTVTSGAPSPTLGRPIAMAYVTAQIAAEARSATGGGRLAVDIRGSAEPAELVPLPFYKRPAPN
jgi:aminomethyltransferase